MNHEIRDLDANEIGAVAGGFNGYAVSNSLFGLQRHLLPYEPEPSPWLIRLRGFGG